MFKFFRASYDSKTMVCAVGTTAAQTIIAIGGAVRKQKNLHIGLTSTIFKAIGRLWVYYSTELEHNLQRTSKLSNEIGNLHSVFWIVSMVYSYDVV